jgi:hypothetical protein
LRLEKGGQVGEIVTIHINRLYEGTNTARLSLLDTYVTEALSVAGEGNDVVLTGEGPIWLYLKIAHAIHGKARKLIYRSPVTGDLVIFDHSPE